MSLPSREAIAQHLAELNWRTLHVASRHAAVHYVAYELSKRKQGVLPDNVVGLGFGSRLRRTKSGRERGKTRVLRDDPCLVVLVDEKRPESYFNKSGRARRVPESIVISVPYRGRQKIKVAVPTDVLEMPRVPRAQGLIGIEVTDPDHPITVRGSVAALVRAAGMASGARYLLTCHHVAFPSVSDADGSTLPPDVDALPSFEQIGQSSRGAFFGYDVGPCVDAAIIRLAPGLAASAIAPPFQPSGFVSSYPEIQAELPSGAWLYSKHHPGGTPVQHRNHLSPFPVEYETGDRATIVEVMTYQMAQSETQAGDSGGALISGNGILLGMHIAGDGAVGYAIPAYKILMASAFAPPITLDMQS